MYFFFLHFHLIIYDTIYKIIIWTNMQNTTFERIPPLIHVLVREKLERRGHTHDRHEQDKKYQSCL